jgi:hypothetical protein
MVKPEPPKEKPEEKPTSRDDFKKQFAESTLPYDEATKTALEGKAKPEIQESPEEKQERLAEEKAEAKSENIRSMLSDLIDEEKKSQSIKKIEKVMAGLDYDKYEGLEDVENAIEEYRSLERSGMSPEEYNDEKASLFEGITEAIEGIEAVVEEEETEIEPEPPKATPVAEKPEFSPSVKEVEKPTEKPAVFETKPVPKPKSNNMTEAEKRSKQDAINQVLFGMTTFEGLKQYPNAKSLIERGLLTEDDIK